MTRKWCQEKNIPRPQCPVSRGDLIAGLRRFGLHQTGGLIADDSTIDENYSLSRVLSEQLCTEIPNVSVILKLITRSNFPRAL
jgi:hypothetical protein